jgi:hypothetical protein
MLELGDFHLQLALAALGPLREYFEDKQLAVEHRHVQCPLEIALLRRAERHVDDGQRRAGFPEAGRQLLDLAAAQVEGRVRPLASRAQFAGDLEAGGDGQLPRLVERIGCLVPGRSTRTDQDADEERARQPRRAGGFDLEGGQEADSVARLTGRAGTTVEMACL